MAKLTLPVSIVDDDDVGADDDVIVTERTTSLSPGMYKIAAEATSLKWKLGNTSVTAATGSFLAAGDQEIIKVPGDVGTTTPLRYIRSQSATADGFINIVKAELWEIPTRDPSAENVN